ncbi:MAG: hypothetical protein RL095_866 [Verrucomicrobiota bacterium]|jgi:ArsR family transcriptional regulator
MVLMSSDTSHSEILKAMADETRIRLLRLLGREELNVQELCEILECPQPKVSRHLAVLRGAGLVIDRKDGTRVYCSLAPLTGRLEPMRPLLEGLAAEKHPDSKRLDAILRQRAETSIDFAERIAGSWDEIGAELHSPLAALYACVGLAPRGMTVADLGCGTGMMLPLLSRLGGQVWAVDQSAEMLAMAKTRCGKHALENIHYLRSDLGSLGGKLPPCDALLLHFVLHQVASPSALLASLKPLLKKGGRLVIVDQLPHGDESARSRFGSVWLGFSQEQLEGWLKKAGFSQIAWTPLSPEERRKASFAVAALA